VYVQDNVEARSLNQSHYGEAICVTCSETVTVALGIQYAMRMWRFILSPVVCKIPQNSSTLSPERQDVGKKI